jgi:hypothetical protein
VPTQTSATEASGVPHVFQAFAAILDEGEAALTRAGAFLCHTDTAAAETAAPSLATR